MSTVFTMPGKIGDALHQWPVAYWYCREHATRCKLWLDENTLKPLEPLFASQPCVEAVEFKPGIKSWHMGGQPWDFDLKTEDYVGNAVYHLGLRKFPTRQLTLEALDQVPFRLNVDGAELGHSLMVAVDLPKRGPRLVLHGTFTSHASGVPGFWKFLSDRHDELAELFGEIAFVGAPGERERALELYPNFEAFDDGGSYLRLAEFIAGASCMIGAGSSNVVLAGLLGVPCVRVHDPIGEAPKVIWNNLGANQLNATELELRTEWNEFRSRWIDAPAAVQP